MTGSEIVQDVPNCPRLVGRRKIWKARDEPFVGGPPSDELAGVPATPLGDSFSKLLGRGLDFPLGLATSIPPRASIRPVQRELAELRRVRPDQGEIGGRNERSIAARELEPDHFAG